MSKSAAIDAALVRTLADIAALPLAPGREDVIAPTLDAWVRDANELSRKMSAAEHWTVTPATVFVHPVQTEEKG
ncbi:MAG: hypothetical protein ABI612_06445 [Betaproteobacteria bacterium]